MGDAPNENGARGGSNSNVEVIQSLTPHPYQSLDPTGHILAVNDAWLDALGYDRDEVEGAYFGDFLAAASAAVYEEKFADFKQTGEFSNREFEMVRADGAVITVEFDGQIEYGPDGSVHRTHCQFKDVTDRRERMVTIRRLSEYRRVLSNVEQTLVRTESKYEMLQRTTDAIADSDLFECTFLALSGEDDPEFVCESGSELDAEAVSAFHTDSYFSKVTSEGTLYIEDVTAPEFAHHEKDHQSHAGLAVSIENAGVDYGVLTVHFEPDSKPDSTEIDLLEQLADDIAVFLRNRHLEEERKSREERLAKRERLFRELHETTRACLDADSEAALFEQIVSGVEDSLGYTDVALFGFDAEAGSLVMQECSEAISETLSDTVRISPANETPWQVFQDGRTRMVDGEALTPVFEREGSTDDGYVAVGIGDYGLLLVGIPEGSEAEDVDIEMMELCTANGEAILGRMRRDAELSETAAQVAAQEARVERFRELVDAFGRIHGVIADAETQSSMERAVCHELVGTAGVDFAWIGRPETTDTHLSRSAWAGDGSAYLDAIDIEGTEDTTPSQLAAESRNTVTIGNISDHVHDGQWAKTALSQGFNSILSIPIIDDAGVLFGVLTVFSRDQEAFDTTQTALLRDIASLMAAYHQIHTIRAMASQTDTVELEFSITDSRFPLFALAHETGTSLRSESVLGTREETVRVLVQVTEGDVTGLLDAARALTQVRAADWFGDPSKERLLLEVERPCLPTVLTKHGARLLSAEADTDAGTVRVSYPSTIPVRPLFERLQTLYDAIELEARRESGGPRSGIKTLPEAGLTDRQLEILRAAYYGGYFETPREISGEDLAASFDISNSAVSKHLRAAQRTVLSALVDSASDNTGLNYEPRT